jgi:hypothetical protein
LNFEHGTVVSRHESDREDLLREATALVERAELTVVGREQPVVAGFRRDGAASFFFGPEAVYQFNAAGELRRAYFGGLLYKAEHGRLVALRRERSPAAVVLVRTELSADDAGDILIALQGQLRSLNEALASGSFIFVGQVPEHGTVIQRIERWLAALPDEIRIANRPNVG